jgi:tetratricopeptide (TPR) repeat protein
MTTKRPKNRSTRVRRASTKRGASSGRAAHRSGNHSSGLRTKSLTRKRLASVHVPGKRVEPRRAPVDERHVAAVRNFESALHFERRQNYRKALEIYQKLVDAAPADVADRARVHLRACIERSGANAPSPKTAGDFHVLGVAELNARQLDRALTYLTKAQKLAPKREEIRYALAAAYSLRGEFDDALAQLEASISLRPQNRFQARRDPDFERLAKDPRFMSLVDHHHAVTRRPA